MTRSALIVIDMLNPYEHPDAGPLAENVQDMIGPLRHLLDVAGKNDDVLVLYVNDNYGDFSADRQDLIERALEGRRPDLVEPIVPPSGCGFLAKVRHSAFYGTALEYVLSREKVDQVVLTGQVTEQCVLYSALDAYVRHFQIKVVRDAVAHIHADLGDAALRMMEENMRAEIVTADQCF
ncbi:cysteine hydrolase [Actinomadura madurae]|uniref:Nicotinamidase-related amidase n=1 Tax=Actinomadura madurae TaxID=1993 RepID=A0A1I5Y2B8_9ACTN|nr:isochorismatase family cysteine hydrolase [Actinomadura madurae]SFQ38329.1 Nicotinamidase-related amidase [Actinomadura madurae]